MQSSNNSVLSHAGSSSEMNVQQVSSGIPSSGPARESGRSLALEETAAETAAHEGRDLTLPGLDHLKLPLLVGTAFIYILFH